MVGRKVSIRYVWWDKNTTIHEEFFKDMFNSSGYEVKSVTNPNEICDFEIIGVHKPRKDRVLDKLTGILKSNLIIGQDNSFAYPYLYNTNTSGAKNKIWLTLENVRPPAQNNFLITLSYDQFDFDETNFYLPAWHMMIGLFGETKLEGDGFGSKDEINSAHFDNLIKSRKLLNYSERLFACAIIGHPHPVRLKGIQSLNRIDKVDVYGRITGNQVKSKFDIAKKYKFTICFENDYYPGYVTEKLLQAYITGTVPIYWGDLGNDSSINRNCFINMSDFSTSREFIEYVSGIDESQYKTFFEQPFLKNVPDVSQLMSKLIAAL